ncbi:MAG: FCD domain-containing protein [Halanaerobium sp.]|nr:FCD domain-containing protein [Halanaerobium sp.]
MITDTEYNVLKIIEQEGEPVGSCTISTKISPGDALSEATVGRILRALDQKGLTRKVGFQGRVLTASGVEELQEYEKNKEKELHIHRFLKLTQVEEKRELLNILVARRAIERETAALAVKNTSGEIIEEMQKIILMNEKLIEQGLSGAEADVQFHQLIARTAGNDILEAALNMIRKDAQLSPVLEIIRREVGGTVVADHKKILQAFERRSAAEAEQAMVQHINNLISDVNKYWRKVHQA